MIQHRPIEGISAVLLPFGADGLPDTGAFLELVERTRGAGLKPALNMDTGYANLLSPAERSNLLRLAAGPAGEGFVAGAFVEDRPGDLLEVCREAFAEIAELGGTPILFPSTLMKAMGDQEVLDLHVALGGEFGRFLIFELGEMFVPFGRVYPLDLVRELMQIPSIVGMKHSSLRRELEWQRLALRDEVRPEFKVYTGNDLAIDMVCWGSDYLLGLSAFHPEAFALRDRWWAALDARFYELNDALQYLGAFAFRPPVPAYKHSCAQFLKLRGRIECDESHPRGMRRPASDVEVLAGALERIEEAMNA